MTGCRKKIGFIPLYRRLPYVILHENIMVEANETINNFNFDYNAVIRPNDIFDEITVRITLAFGKRTPTTIEGSSNKIMNNDKPYQEADSFYVAANKAWSQYSHSEDDKKNFVKAKLLEKWSDLNGEELTKKDLELK